MTIRNVRLILGREIRDQLRDRRTLFMIIVLPILIYPLMGLSVLQIEQFKHERPTEVLVVGARMLADLPPLVENKRFAARLFADPAEQELLELSFAPDEPRPGAGRPPTRGGEDARTAAWRAVQAGEFDAALCFPDDFAQRLQLFRQAIRERLDPATESDQAASAARVPPDLQVPSPVIIYSTATRRSVTAYTRLADVLRRWTESIAEDNLAASGLPPEASRPFSLQSADVADETGLRGAATWAVVLPVVLVLWTMTGAFYPAVDLCAGEKERGTLETLLSSPAQRSEIVLGKLATIMIFSMVTAVLNLVSTGLTGWAVMAHLPNLGPPPALAAVWLALALVPLAALFSALCLALAAFARSSKEGQYYLMPLMLVTFPLVVLPMSPGVELSLGNSLIPITGLVLLLRGALEGNYGRVLPYVLPVDAVTLAGCVLAIRWAVDQFNSEAVLFRESERLDLRLWLRHLVRDRQPTPSVANALACGVLILVIRFFVNLAASQPEEFRDFAATTLVTQLTVILAPALVMTVMLTSSPRRTLLLRLPFWRTVPAALALALVLHPAVMTLQVVVLRLYPIAEGVRTALDPVQRMFAGASFGQILLLLAVVPAICEELAFRGFILSGLRHLGRKWRAIVYSALLFGFAHGVLQQSMIACLIGTVLGYVAVQSGSLLPGVAFHLVHNTLGLAAARVTPAVFDRWPALVAVASPLDDGGYEFHWPIIIAGLIAAALLLAFFHRLPYPKSAEEAFQEAVERAGEQ
jgi:sodium transport system permease protein